MHRPFCVLKYLCVIKYFQVTQFQVTQNIFHTKIIPHGTFSVSF